MWPLQISSSVNKYLRFDDRIVMFVGIVILTLVMPFIVLRGNADQGITYNYLIHVLPETFTFILSFWIAFRMIIIEVRKRMPHSDAVRTRVIVEGLLIFISIPIIKWILTYVLDLLCPWTEEHYIPQGPQIMTSIYIPSIIVLTIYEAIYFYYKLQEEVSERQKLESQHIQAQLDNLRSQVNPHFLYNGLNTLMGLIPTNQDAAMKYLNKMSKFYRYAASSSEDKLIPLSKEIEYTNLYIDLVRQRFKEGLIIETNFTDHQHAWIPPLSLQLLLENAVKHNIVSKKQPLTVKFSINRKDGYIKVENKKQEKLNRYISTGIGLRNIRQRFQHFTLQPIRIMDTEDTFAVLLPIINTKVNAKSRDHRG